MSATSNKPSQTKEKRHNKRYVFWLVGFFIVVAVFGLAYNQYQQMQNDKNKKSQNVGVYKGGPGGDPKKVISLNDEATAAWKAGDKQKAKDLAQQAIDAYEQLTSDQQKTIPGPIDVVINLNSIKRGYGPR